MRYFAMIDGERKGPFTLAELHEAGVKPDTYVWCKDMPDWQQASQVADICRFYRQRIFDLNHPKSTEQHTTDLSVASGQPAENPDQTPKFTFSRFSSYLSEEEKAEMEKILAQLPDNYRDVPPADMRGAAWMAALLFFLPTGIAAIIYATRSQKLWCKSKSASAEDADALAKEAYDKNRIAKMLTGISFFIAMIIIPFVIFSF